MKTGNSVFAHHGDQEIAGRGEAQTVGEFHGQPLIDVFFKDDSHEGSGLAVKSRNLVVSVRDVKIAIVAESEITSIVERIVIDEDPEVKEWIKEGAYPGALISPTMVKAWDDDHLEFVEGRFPQFVESLIIQYTELAKMLQNQQSPEETMKTIVEQVNDITGYTDLMKAK